jgi:hypothetical protein
MTPIYCIHSWYVLCIIQCIVNSLQIMPEYPLSSLMLYYQKSALRQVSFPQKKINRSRFDMENLPTLINNSKLSHAI